MFDSHFFSCFLIPVFRLCKMRQVKITFYGRIRSHHIMDLYSEQFSISLSVWISLKILLTVYKYFKSRNIHYHVMMRTAGDDESLKNYWDNGMWASRLRDQLIFRWTTWVSYATKNPIQNHSPFFSRLRF